MPSLEPTEGNEVSSAPVSPYTAVRLQVRNLTMPPIPNFDIPPSPPGSPPPVATAKFKRFLDLKKQGTHFNERLNQSSALRDPGLLQRLLGFAGIKDEDQYASSLPVEVAVPTKYPSWAYADELVKAHEKIAKQREQDPKGKRDKVDFVPSRVEDTNVPSRPASGTRADGPKTKKSRLDDKDVRNRRRSRSPH